MQLLVISRRLFGDSGVHLLEKRGRPIGSPEEDWVEAEEELRVLLDAQRPPFSSIAMGAVTG